MQRYLNIFALQMTMRKQTISEVLFPMQTVIVVHDPNVCTQTRVSNKLFSIEFSNYHLNHIVFAYFARMTKNAQILRNGLHTTTQHT